jgi:hypothetical protein
MDIAQISALKAVPSLEPYSKEVLSILQGWLFIGSLEDIVGRRILVKEFFVETKKRPLISTSFLVTLLGEGKAGFTKMDTKQKQKRNQQLTAILSEMQFWCFKLSSLSLLTEESPYWNRTPQEYTPVSPSHLHPDSDVDSLSRLVTLAGEAINTAKAYLPNPASIAPVGFLGSYTHREQKRLVYQLARCGWCPFMARVLFTYRYSIAEFAAFWPMTGSAAKSKHKNCTGMQYVAYNIDPTTYRAKHVKPNCTCENICPDVEEIIWVIKLGDIPVLSLSHRSSTCQSGAVGPGYAPDPIILKDTPASTLPKPICYAAISHVWSDGMGSVTEEGLPRCRIEKIFSTTRTYNQHHLWVDSLCVPSEKESRKNAIRLMGETYKKASLTFVINRTISSIKFTEEADGVELIILKLIMSPWMQRLWTLQEAMLSRWLVFEFSNKFASAFDVLAIASSTIYTRISPITQVVLNEFKKLLTYRSDIPIDQKEVQLGDIYRLLRLRSTSKAGDETLTIAGLFSIDAAILVQAPVEDRMKLFLKIVRQIPNDFIFVNRPRMEDTGFRWAVKLMMIRGKTSSAADDPLSLITRQRAQ